MTTITTDIDGNPLLVDLTALDAHTPNSTVVAVDLGEVAVALQIEHADGTTRTYRLDVPTAHRLGAGLTETAARLAGYAGYYSRGTATAEYLLPADDKFTCGQTHQHGNDCHPKCTAETCPCGGGSTGPCSQCGQPLHRHDDDEFGRVYLCLNDECTS